MTLVCFPENSHVEQAILLDKLKDTAPDSWSVGALNSRAVKELLHPQTLTTEVLNSVLDFERAPQLNGALGWRAVLGLCCSKMTLPALGEHNEVYSAKNDVSAVSSHVGQ